MSPPRSAPSSKATATQRGIRLRGLATAAVLCLFVAACETIPTGPPAPEKEQAARALVEAGEFNQAAQAYLDLAAQVGSPWAEQYRLAAADALVRAREAQAAKGVLAGTDLRRAPDLTVRRDLLLARIALLEGRPQRVFELLPEVVEGETPAPLAIEVHRLRAQAYERWGDFVGAARERVALELWLDDPGALRENRRALWESLNRMTPNALAEARIPPPDTLGGWVELAYVANRTLTDPSAFQQALGEWRERYPGHPAVREMVPELRELSLERAAPPQHVAVLLPFEGRFARAAEAVRDGFLAAWYADTENPARPEVTVRDASAANVRSVYERAVEAGADFVVGPLDKESVSTLARSAHLTVPTLALNVVSAAAEETEHTDEMPAESESLAGEETAPVAPAPENENPAGEAPDDTGLPDALYQFALSPEGEARRVAERAWFDGHESAGVIVPEGAWGERVAGAFTDAWERLGGSVVESQTYPNDTPEMSASVERLLNVNESRARWLALRRLLGRDIEYEPRVRKDIDFVFMAAFPRQARQLRPQLKFHKAEDIPVYATSHVFSGVEDASADRDIDGVIFGDMPWVLLPQASDDLRQKIESAWSDSFEDYVRLYAFGVDAYRVIPHLGKLRARRYATFNGETGRLSLDAANRIRRQLMWAEFRDGSPQTAVSDMALQ